MSLTPLERAVAAATLDVADADVVVTSPNQMFGPPVAPPEEVAGKVADLWNSWGFDVDIATVGEAVEVAADTDEATLVFGAGPGGTDLYVACSEPSDPPMPQP